MDVQEYNATKAAADNENPTGAWSGGPALAATTVAMKNTSGYAVWADVVGGTVTVITAAGEITGLTSGSFLLQPNQSIAITYSVAPTLSWRYQQVGPWHPKGAWAGAPALAATTVAMVNSSGYPVNVYVFSSTVTVMKINGVTTGLTNEGTLRLGPGDTCALTYASGTPTLAWIYE